MSVLTKCSDLDQVGQRELVILKAFTPICRVAFTNNHIYTQTHWRDGLFASKARPLSIKRYMLWPQKQATAQACMASASQLPEPRHGAEGGAWGWDKPFYPWSLPRRGDRTGLEPQLSTADNIHMCWMCFEKMLLLGGFSVSVCVKWEHDAGVQKFGCLLK